MEIKKPAVDITMGAVDMVTKLMNYMCPRIIKNSEKPKEMMLRTFLKKLTKLGQLLIGYSNRSSKLTITLAIWIVFSIFWA